MPEAESLPWNVRESENLLELCHNHRWLAIVGIPLMLIGTTTPSDSKHRSGWAQAHRLPWDKSRFVGLPLHVSASAACWTGRLAPYRYTYDFGPCESDATFFGRGNKFERWQTSKQMGASPPVALVKILQLRVVFACKYIPPPVGPDGLRRAAMTFVGVRSYYASRSYSQNNG